jgi:histidinol-phosphate aminotransferase
MSYIRPDVDRIAGYAPGEQPQEGGWVKLNTNENPYPPSPRVVEAIERAAGGRLNIYPDPLAGQFRRVAGRLFDVDPDCIIPANGSDENLTILVRTFVDAGELISYPYPSYILYESLADLQGAKHERILLNPDWTWNHSIATPIVERSKLVLLPNPNSPSGNRWSDEDIVRLAPPRGVLVLDEAYGDFCDNPHRAQILKRPEGRQIVVTRTLSKSYSLAGVRFGFAIARPEFIVAMRKVKDSYNCNTLSLAAAIAALEDQEWMLQNVAKIRATRARLTQALRALGWRVVESQSNFLWCTHDSGEHRKIYESLKARKILVRYMRFPLSDEQGGGVRDGLRITVGTDAEIDTLLAAIAEVM